MVDIRKMICITCKKFIGVMFLESVWESSDEKTFSLIHHICLDCYNKNKDHLPKIQEKVN